MNTLVTQFFFPLSPVLSIVGGAILLTILEFFPEARLQRVKASVAALATLLSIVFTLLLWATGSFEVSSEVVETSGWLLEFKRTYRLDVFTLALYFGIGLFSTLAIFLVHFHFQHRKGPQELYLLLLFVISGMQFLVSANSLIILFLALELMSLPTYVLVATHRQDPKSCEASLKYFLFGAFASVLFVLGAAFLYASYGTLHLGLLAERIQVYLSYENSPFELLVFTYGGLTLLAIAGGFKIGLAPFHMWVPDTYEGAPSAVTGFMGSAIKLAGFALLVRLLWGIFIPVSSHWVPVLNTLAIISMFVGNLAALAQTNLKRIFAYSSVAHAGYLILCVTAVAPFGPNFDALYYYLITYGLMFLGVFAVIELLETRYQSSELHELSGMGFTHPILGICLSILVLSGAGIPPTAGFLAKYFVFLEAVKAGHTFQVVLAVISSLIGAFYYLRVLVYLYMRENKREGIPLLRAPTVFVCIVFCALSMLYLAAVPSSLAFGP
ncbi:MAG: NADH-quinone oxidoreductase subunit N [Bdellovibrionota bacterium]